MNLLWNDVSNFFINKSESMFKNFENHDKIKLYKKERMIVWQ